MNFHNQAVGSRGDTGCSHIRNKIGMTSSVARVDDHGQVRELLEHRHRGEVEREARLARVEHAVALDLFSADEIDEHHIERGPHFSGSQGEGFDPEAVADPLAPENLLKSSGRGISRNLRPSQIFR